MSTEVETRNPAPSENAPLPPPAPAPKVSFQMRAVITILASDPALFDVVSPFINYVEGTIDWQRISELTNESVHRHIVDWAYICYFDKCPEGSNPFLAIQDLEAHFKKAIAKALLVRWGVAK